MSLERFRARVAAAFVALGRSDLVVSTTVRCGSGGPWVARCTLDPGGGVIEIHRDALGLPPVDIDEIAGHEVAHVVVAHDSVMSGYTGHGGPWIRLMRRLGYPSPRMRFGS